MKIMGILNLTPDSFSDGSLFNDPGVAVERAWTLYREGADLLDLGAESTRPGHTPVTAQEEISRLIPVLRELRNFPIPISVDTQKSQVAAAALEAGARILNDIWGFQQDPHMAELVASGSYQCVLMHNQNGTDYEEDLITSILRFFEVSVEKALSCGVTEDQIILDPGLGFGKRLEHNWEVLRRLNEIVSFGFPVLVGASRKRFLGDLLQCEARERMVGTLATSLHCLNQGVSIVRVHDVKEHAQALRVMERIHHVPTAD